MNLTHDVRVPFARLQDAGKEQLRTVQHYFDRRHLEASLQAELPALAKLAQLAQPRSPRATISKVVLIILASIATSLLIGLAGAFIRFGYLLGGGR